MSYVTTKEAKKLEKNLEKAFNEIFNVHTEDDLTAKELKVWRMCDKDDILYWDGTKYEDLNKKGKELYDSAKHKLEGDELNVKNETKALDVLIDAYFEHKHHEQPKWWQLGKRYSYWREKKSIESYEELLMGKGISKKTIDNLKKSIDEPKAFAVLHGVETNDKAQCSIDMEMDDVSIEKAKDQDSVERFSDEERSYDSFDAMLEGVALDDDVDSYDLDDSVMNLASV